MANEFRLKDWVFDPATHTLSRLDATVRLEHRAAMLLLLLCERPGQTVSQREIIDRVWKGRHVSGNSVPVVIGDLRRALGDDAKHPRFIETVTKGGYRLVAPAYAVAPARAPARRRAWGLVAAAAAAAAAATVFALPTVRAAPTMTLIVEDMRNATGFPAYDTLTAASGGEWLGRVAAHSNLAIARSGPAAIAAEVRLTGKLVLWSRKPELLFEAREIRSGKLLWNGEIFVPEPQIPRALVIQADDLSKTLESFRIKATSPVGLR